MQQTRIEGSEMIKFYLDKQNKYRARITAKNGEIIFGSHQGYTSLQNCKDNLIDIAIAVDAELGSTIGD